MTIIKKIPAGAVVNAQGEGRNFWVVFCPVEIEIRVPGGEFETYSQGTGLNDLPDGGKFARLDVRNPSAGEVTVVLYVGGPLYRDARSALIEPKTVGVAHATISLNATSGVTLTGVPTGLRIRRKSVQLTNLDAVLNLQIRDAGGGVLATVFPEQTYTLPISEQVECYNPNGSAVACNISEIWWTL
ncbi:MAG TPA: hypothetical protein VEB66_02310 [Opitutaceae bacterium]|nr:hypothetical protein [Opitutaceae bacterium]